MAAASSSTPGSSHPLEITATGPWSVTILPFAEEHVFPRLIDVPGTLDGRGDDIVFIRGKPDTATITGNADEHHFAVIAYSPSGPDLLINTLDAYEGTTILDPETVALAIQAIGPWSVSIKDK